MVRAPDLTRDEWQSKVTDTEIAASIRNGKGKMPAFNVPGPVLEGLVTRVRATRMP
jgi:cytochrome c oxidase cbb3-type subunit 3